MFETALFQLRYSVFHSQSDRPQPPSTHMQARRLHTTHTRARTHTLKVHVTTTTQAHGEKGKLNENEVEGGEKEGEGDLVRKKV